MTKVDMTPEEAILTALVLQKWIGELEHRLRTRFDPFVCSEDDEVVATDICRRIEIATRVKDRLLSVRIPIEATNE